MFGKMIPKVIQEFCDSIERLVAEGNDFFVGTEGKPEELVEKPSGRVSLEHFGSSLFVCVETINSSRRCSAIFPWRNESPRTIHSGRSGRRWTRFFAG